MEIEDPFNQFLSLLIINNKKKKRNKCHIVGIWKGGGKLLKISKIRNDKYLFMR